MKIMHQIFCYCFSVLGKNIFIIPTELLYLCDNSRKWEKSFGRKFHKDQITSLLEHKSVNFLVQSEGRKNAKGLYLSILSLYLSAGLTGKRRKH